jgi:hypothetical protein
MESNPDNSISERQGRETGRGPAGNRPRDKANGRDQAQLDVDSARAGTGRDSSRAQEDVSTDEEFVDETSNRFGSSGEGREAYEDDQEDGDRGYSGSGYRGPAGPGRQRR